MKLPYLILVLPVFVGCESEEDWVSASSCEHPIQIQNDGLCGGVSFDKAEYDFGASIRVRFKVRNETDQTAKEVVGVANTTGLEFDGAQNSNRQSKQLNLQFGELAAGEEKALDVFATSQAAGSLGLTFAIGHVDKQVGGSRRSEINHFRLAAMLPGKPDKYTDDFFAVRDRCVAKHGEAKEPLRTCMKDAGLFD